MASAAPAQEAMHSPATGSLSTPMAAPDLEDGEAREVFTPSKQERTGFWTHYCCHLVRLVFLLSHGVLVLAVSTCLGNLDQADWWLLFRPVWVGDITCCILAVVSWFASCPYICAACRERRVRLDGYPSWLTEVIPEIVLAIMGFILLLLISFGEYNLCLYLDTAQRGTPKGLPASVGLLSTVSMLALCHGVLLLHNSPLYLSLGGALLATMIAFAATRGEGASAAAKAVVLVPSVVASFGVLLGSLHRLRRHSHLLCVEERLLRASEALLLGVLLFASVSATHKVAGARLQEAGPEGATAGIALCVAAAVRARLCWWEAWKGPLDDRWLAQGAVPTDASAAEVQICMTGQA